MSNLLKMAVSETIRTLHRRGWSQRRIADELGINRETVARHLRQADPLSKPANASPGLEGDEGAPEHTVAPPGSTPNPQPRGSGRASGCEPWRDVIRAKCDLGLTAQRIYQDLVADHGFAGTYYCVRRFVHRLEGAHDLPFRRIECDPGDEAQDNLKAAVKTADWFDPEINPKVRSFGEHYGTVFLPTRPYTPRHKGKGERGVDYVQENALRGRSFPSLEEQNRFLRDWEATTADTRMHGTTRRHVCKHFLEVERAALLPLPADPFPSFREARRAVHRDGHVEVDHAYYSVPPEYLARRVWVRWDARTVRVFNDRMEQVAVHVRHDPGRFSTQPVHIASEKISGVERGAAWQLERVRRLGPQSTRWAEGVVEARGVEAVRVLIGLSSLAGRHPAAAIERACTIAAGYGAYHLRTVRALIDRDAPRQETMPFMSEHPMIRPLSDYSRFVHDAFQQKEVLS